MKKIEELRDELIKVSKVAPKGSHVKVARIIGLSTGYLFEIRAGENVTLDIEKNHQLIQSLIDEYRRLVRAEQIKLQSI